MDNRCTIPFIGLPRIHLNNNTVSPCCKILETPIDPVLGILNKSYIQLRQDVKDNKRNPQCASCWKIDDEGGPSFRRRHSEHFNKLIDWQNLDINQPIRNIEIVFSNKCQLMCVYCFPSISSMWEDQQERFANFKGFAVKSAESRKLHELVDVNLLKHVQITGGEPMLDQDCIDFMLSLPFDQDRSIAMITNLSYGTAVFEKLNNIIDRHPNITMMCSLDAIGENPTRKYLNWDLWNKNFEAIAVGLQERRKKYSDISVILKFTMNIMNYMNVRDIIEYILKYRQNGIAGVTFDINIIAHDELTSMRSGIIDQSFQIEIDNRLKSLLSKRELNNVIQFNTLLKNVILDPVLSNRTEEFLRDYLK